jgi:UDP-glucose 4-epimerase
VQPVFRPREVLVTQREASVDRIREVLGWEPTVDLAEGLSSVVDHLKNTGELA